MYYSDYHRARKYFRRVMRSIYNGKALSGEEEANRVGALYDKYCKRVDGGVVIVANYDNSRVALFLRNSRRGQNALTGKDMVA